MTLLGPDGPLHVGAAGEAPQGYLLYDGVRYVAVRSAGRVLAAGELWGRPGLSGLEASARPPASDEARAGLKGERDAYRAAFGLLRGELARLAGGRDVERPGPARRGGQVVVAFGQRLGYELSRDTVDRLGELYADLREIVAQLRASGPAAPRPSLELVRGAGSGEVSGGERRLGAGWELPAVAAVADVELSDSWRAVVDALDAEVAAGRDKTTPELAERVAAARKRTDGAIDDVLAAGGDTAWRRGLTALLQYWRRNGHPFVPQDHPEEVGGVPIRPRRWLDEQRTGRPGAVPAGVWAVIHRLGDVRAREILVSVRAEVALGWHGRAAGDGPDGARVTQARNRLDAALKEQEGSPQNDRAHLGNVRLLLNNFREKGNLKLPGKNSLRTWLENAGRGQGPAWTREFVEVLRGAELSPAPFDGGRVIEGQPASHALAVGAADGLEVGRRARLASRVLGRQARVVQALAAYGQLAGEQAIYRTGVREDDDRFFSSVIERYRGGA
jgi:hypothetical protein